MIREGSHVCQCASKECLFIFAFTALCCIMSFRTCHHCQVINIKNLFFIKGQNLILGQDFINSHRRGRSEGNSKDLLDPILTHLPNVG